MGYLRWFTRSMPVYELPLVVESSLQIAWDFLMGCGEITDHQQTAEFLLRHINAQIVRGERRKIALANRAIQAYRHGPLKLVS
jgi:hypothetical protein